jgi:hypothetical protein
MKPPKIEIKTKNTMEQHVQIKRGRKIVVDRVVCLDRAELDAFLLGCKLIEDILEKSKGAQDETGTPDKD